MGLFGKLLPVPHSHIAKTEWRGDYLYCKRCGEILGVRVPIAYRSSNYMFTPFTSEAKIHTKEICEKYNLYDSDAFLHMLNEGILDN